MTKCNSGDNPWKCDELGSLRRRVKRGGKNENRKRKENKK